MTVASTKGRAVVYATAPSSHHVRVRDRCTRVPEGLVHAKTPGGVRALCGADVTTWPRFYDMSFFRVEKNRCPGCSSAALAMSRRYLAPST